MEPRKWRRNEFDSARTLRYRSWRSSSRSKAYRESVSNIIPGLCLTKSPLVTATIQGILSCLTATFWGSVRVPIVYIHCIRLKPLKFTDRNGRVPFLSLNFTALLLADAALAALAVAPDYVPGGYWFIVYVSAFEGLIGGRCRCFGFDDQVMVCHIWQDLPRLFPQHVHILQTAAIQPQGPHVYPSAVDIATKQIL
jgi:hypothetical protein